MIAATARAATPVLAGPRDPAAYGRPHGDLFRDIRRAPAFGLEPQRALLLRLTEDHSVAAFIITKGGKPRTEKSFSQWFSRAASDAGLPDLSAHGLRKYRVNQLAEAGTPLLAMQAWVGHTTLTEVQRYTQRASRRNVFFGHQSPRAPG